jgi:Bacterial Ig-like domain/Bacterial TSP3 repeat
MAVVKKVTSIKKTPKKSRAQKVGTNVPVRGDDPLFSIEFTSFKKQKVKKRTTRTPKAKQKLLRASSVRTFTPLISISLDEHVVAKVTKYAGLFCICIGACFSSYAVAGLYVDTLSLSIDHTVPHAHLHAAVASNPLFSLQTSSSLSDVHASSSSTTVPHASSTVSTDSVLTDTQMQPIVALEIHSATYLKNIFSIDVSVAQALSVTLYARKDGGLTNIYIGNALHTSETAWTVLFDSRTIPNGDYNIFAHVKNKYGTYESRMYRASIANARNESANATSSATSLRALALQSQVNAVLSEFETTDPKADLRAELLSYVGRTATQTPATSTASSTAHDLTSRQLSFVNEVDLDFKHLLEMYAVVLRAKDIGGADRVLAHINEFKRQTLDRLSTDLLPTAQSDSDVIQNLRDRVSAVIVAETMRTKKQEDLISARVGNLVSIDTDHDGVVDYDELTLYHTDPLNPDTDGDGYTDGAEILAGYDPNKADGAVLRVSEDPRKNGISRPDILEISNASVLHATATGEVPEKILFTGKGLRNSFVTISIYSTPITAITKTDANGLWSYVLDAPLDNGQHQVYVSLEDNAGRIVAKSLPFFFVKDAGMYTLGTLSEKTLSAVGQPANTLSLYAYVLIASFVVLSVGLLMLLISMFMTHRYHLRVAKRMRASSVA